MSAKPRELAWDMAAAMSPAFFKWGIGAVLHWDPSPIPPSTPVRHIHGSRDLLMPLAGVQPTRIVQGGGHLLTLTHPARVNAFLLEVLREVDGYTGGRGGHEAMRR
jgi:pimeloyl-ACP methyl ester carboxylesterase